MQDPHPLPALRRMTVVVVLFLLLVLPARRALAAEGETQRPFQAKVLTILPARQPSISRKHRKGARVVAAVVAVATVVVVVVEVVEASAAATAAVTVVVMAAAAVTVAELVLVAATRLHYR